jgi:parallel beta-helix repeat protein
MSRCLALASAFLLTPFVAVAGDLSPPAGSIQPTDRFTINPQTAVFPIQIVDPGSYVLLGDLTVTGPTNGIEILASNVTIDLNGFTLDGAGVGIEGIYDQPGLESISIRNGTVRGFVQGGVFMSASSGSIVERVRAVGNGFEGIVAGRGSLVANCVATGNSLGIGALNYSQIIDCVTDASADIGIYLENDASVRGCQVSRSAGAGISIGYGCVVSNNTVSSGGADNAGAPGIYQRTALVGRSRIDSNHVTGYNPGVRVDPGITLAEVLIVRNSVFDADGFVGYDTASNVMNVGLSFDPDTADAWDNFWWVTITRAGDEPEPQAAPTQPLPPGALMSPHAYRRSDAN